MICGTCGIEFSKPDNPWHVYKYCSVACSARGSERRANHATAMKAKGRRSGKLVNCLMCETEFYAMPYAIKKGWGKYCSRDCAAAAQRGVPSGRTPPNKGQPMSVEQRAKLSAAATGRTGERSNAWKGGLTAEHTLIRSSSEGKAWTRAVLERDNFTCQECGVRGGPLVADHIKSFAYFPDLRFDLANGRTLCDPCHKLTPNYAGKARQQWLAEQTQEA